METAEYWKERAEIWHKQAREYKEQHEKDTSLMARLAVANIKFKGDGCTCTNKPGDEYYCPVHGGEGSWIDLKVKIDMLIEKLGDWIVLQNNDTKRSAKDVFGSEMKVLGQTLYKLQGETERSHLLRRKGSELGANSVED